MLDQLITVTFARGALGIGSALISGPERDEVGARRKHIMLVGSVLQGNNIAVANDTGANVGLLAGKLSGVLKESGENLGPEAQLNPVNDSISAELQGAKHQMGLDLLKKYIETYGAKGSELTDGRTEPYGNTSGDKNINSYSKHKSNKPSNLDPNALGSNDLADVVVKSNYSDSSPSHESTRKRRISPQFQDKSGSSQEE